MIYVNIYYDAHQQQPREKAWRTGNAANAEGPSGGERLLRCGDETYFIVGMMNSAPSRTPEGQREVTVLIFVKKWNESGPC